jgi:hypothetical protein
MEAWLITLISIIALIVLLGLFLIPIFFIKVKPKENTDVEIGEYHMRDFLASHMDNTSMIFNGVIIKNIKNGNTTEIDHIVINKAGIFVIETKDWKGIIHGDNDSDYFHLVTMNSYENITTNIKNPIKQNMGHIKALQNVLGTNGVKYYNCVVFVRGSIRDIDSEYVFTPESLIDYIKEQPNILTIEAVQLLSNTLKDYLLKYPVTHEEHVENLKKRYNE